MTSPAAERQIAPAPPIDRLIWLDVARGIGIVLVVIGHALGGLIDSPLAYGRLDLRQAFFCIYSFHMPLFFILSGAMVARRVERNRKDFAFSLVPDLLWPYFLWSVIQATLIYMLGGMTNQQIQSLGPMLGALPITPISQFWFLYALFVMHLTAIMLYPTLGRNGFLLFCLALKSLPLLLSLPVIVRLVVAHAPWYGIGVFLAAPGLVELVVKRPVWVRLALLPLVAAALIGASVAASGTFVPAADLARVAAPGIAGLAWNHAVFPAALIGALAVIGFAGSDLGRFGHLLAFLGQRSMPIFILHIMGIAGLRIALVRFFGITDVFLMLPLMVLAGIVLPLIAFAIAARFEITRVAGLGRG